MMNLNDMKYIDPVKVLEWQKRPMTKEEMLELSKHLSHLYEIVREAYLMMHAFHKHGETIGLSISSASNITTIGTKK